jgi:hypothetical protein
MRANARVLIRGGSTDVGPAKSRAGQTSAAVGDGRPGRFVAVAFSASRRVGVRVVERVNGATRRDGDLKAGACFEIANGKLDAIARRVPEELNFVGSAQS